MIEVDLKVMNRDLNSIAKRKRVTWGYDMADRMIHA